MQASSQANEKASSARSKWRPRTHSIARVSSIGFGGGVALSSHTVGCCLSELAYVRMLKGQSRRAYIGTNRSNQFILVETLQEESKVTRLLAPKAWRDVHLTIETRVSRADQRSRE